MEAVNLNDYQHHKISEKVIVQRILAGEKELYEILVRRNNQKLYRIIRTYLKNEVQIEDVMQNTYIKAFTKLYQFKQDAQFSTWLIRIGINEALSELRKNTNIVHIDSYRHEDDDDFVLEIPDHQQLNPQEKMAQKEVRQLLEKAIDQLDVKYREVYMMKEVEEMSLKEISLALDISLANVKIRLHRSREMLKEKLYRISNTTEIFEFGFSRCDRITENVMKNI